MESECGSAARLCERAALVAGGAVAGACAAWLAGRAVRGREPEQPEEKSAPRPAAGAGAPPWFAQIDLRRWPKQRAVGREGMPPIRPIGVLRSCYQQCHGIPRQPLLAMQARGYIELTHRSIQGDSLLDLDQYSHVWVIFLFHDIDSTAVDKMKAADEGRAKFKSKVFAPRAGGRRQGVFATRTPHRPNAIGLSIARLDGVDTRAGRVYLSGSDIMDATPVLDIKPYLPAFDTARDARVPRWVEEPSPRRDVCMAPEVIELLGAAAAAGTGRFYRDGYELVRAVAEGMAVDVSRRTPMKRALFCFDGCVLVFVLVQGPPTALPSPRDLSARMPMSWYGEDAVPAAAERGAAAVERPAVVAPLAAESEARALLADLGPARGQEAPPCRGAKWLWLERSTVDGGGQFTPSGLTIGVFSACAMSSPHWIKGDLAPPVSRATRPAS